MQVPDHAFGAQHLLTIELQNDAQHSMRRRMLRPHVDDEFVRIEISVLGSFQVKIRDGVGAIALFRPSLSALDSQVDLHPLLILLQDVVVLAQRKSLPFLGQKNALQIRMSVELDPEHVEDFALKPVCRRPDRHRRWSDSPSAICVFTRIRSLRANEYKIHSTSNCFSRLG